jgi:hypothetical protein
MLRLATLASTETVVLQLAPGPYRIGVPSHATVRLVSDDARGHVVLPLGGP